MVKPQHNKVVNEYHAYQPSHEKGKLIAAVEDDDDEINGLPLFSYYESLVSTSVTHLYISQPICDPAAYTPLIQFFQTRSSGDVIHMHFNSPGGRLDTGIQILTAMMSSPAHIIGHLDGVAYSMAAIMYLACHSHTVSPFGRLMFHVYSSSGGGGKAPDLRAALESNDEIYASLVQKLCTPFLSKREIKDMLENSRDLYFTADEVVDRLNHGAAGAAKLKAKALAPRQPKQPVVKQVEPDDSKVELLQE